MCNLGEGIYERAVAEEQARQTIEIEKLLKKMEAEREAERKAEREAEKNRNNKKIQELIAAGLDAETVKRIMES